MMRVGLVSREYPPFFGGGIGTYVRSVAPTLAEHGCEVRVVTQAHDATHPRLSVEGRVTVHRAPFFGEPCLRAGNILRFGAMTGAIAADLARRGAIDVVEFPECEGAGAAMAALRAVGRSRDRAAGCATVVHLHTPAEMLLALRTLHFSELNTQVAAYALVERAGILLADLVCAPSRFIARWAREHYGLSIEPTVVPYPLERTPDAPAWAGRKRVLYVGRLESRKGVEPLIEAWKMVSPSRPGWSLRLVGADTTTAPGARSMEAHLRALLPPAVARTVEFAGAVAPEQIGAEFAAASLCVVPSLWENFPYTCMEAMSHARPLIVSDQGGMAEMLGDSGAGVQFRSGDAADLASTLGAMMDEPVASLRARGDHARRRITSMCDRATVARQRVGLYREAIDRAVRGPDASTRDTQRRLRLRMWRQARSLCRGDLSGFGVPTPPPGTERWLVGSPAA